MGGGLYGSLMAVTGTSPAASTAAALTEARERTLALVARLSDVDGFRGALDAALAADRSTIVSVRTDRDANVTLHRKVWEAVAGSVRTAN